MMTKAISNSRVAATLKNGTEGPSIPAHAAGALLCPAGGAPREPGARASPLGPGFAVGSHPQSQAEGFWLPPTLPTTGGSDRRHTHPCRPRRGFESSWLGNGFHAQSE